MKKTTSTEKCFWLEHVFKFKLKRAECEDRLHEKDISYAEWERRAIDLINVQEEYIYFQSNIIDRYIELEMKG